MATGVGTATAISCSNVAPVFVTKFTLCVSPSTQGKGRLIQAVSPLAIGCLRALPEFPIGIIDLNLGNHHRVGPAGTDERLQSIVVKDRPLDGQVFDGWCAVVKTLERIRLEQPDDCDCQNGDRDQQPEETRQARQYWRVCEEAVDRFVHHDSVSLTSNMPIQPSSVNSD